MLEGAAFSMRPDRSNHEGGAVNRHLLASDAGSDLPPISPWREMGAYEALFLRGMTFPKLADLFRRHLGTRPSEFVPPDQAERCAREADGKLKDAGIRDYDVRINGMEDYPARLRDARDPAELLYCQGTWVLSEMPSLSVVGSRRPSREGLLRAERLAREIVREEFAVVSGLASGIDTAAHLAALESGGATIAVIGTPLAECYPPSNGLLQDAIAEDHLLISLVPVLGYAWQSASQRRRNFPERNATMSALTLGTIIVEAGERSGTHHQARAALHKGRKLFILDSCFGKPSIKWPQRYEGLGAIRVREPRDIWVNLDV